MPALPRWGRASPPGSWLRGDVEQASSVARDEVDLAARGSTAPSPGGNEAEQALLVLQGDQPVADVDEGLGQEATVLDDADAARLLDDEEAAIAGRRGDQHRLREPIRHRLEDEVGAGRRGADGLERSARVAASIVRGPVATPAGVDGAERVAGGREREERGKLAAPGHHLIFAPGSLPRHLDREADRVVGAAVAAGRGRGGAGIEGVHHLDRGLVGPDRAGGGDEAGVPEGDGDQVPRGLGADRQGVAAGTW